MRLHVVPKPERYQALEGKFHGAALTNASLKEAEEYKELNRKWVAQNLAFDEKISTFDQ